MLNKPQNSTKIKLLQINIDFNYISKIIVGQLYYTTLNVNLYILTDILEAFLGNLLNNVSHSQGNLVLLVLNSVSNLDHFSGLHVQGGTSPLF